MQKRVSGIGGERKKMNQSVLRPFFWSIILLLGFSACAGQDTAVMPVTHGADAQREAEPGNGEPLPPAPADIPQEDAPPAGTPDVAVFPQLGPSREVSSVAYSPDGKWIVSGGSGTVKVWDVESGREIRNLVGHSG
jgi:WD40 repeat protein